MKLIVLVLLLISTVTYGKVVRAVDEQDIFTINDKYPSRYSVVIFVGQEVGFWARLSGFFGESKHKQQERELREIIDFFEKEPHYEIPVIEADTDKADFANVMEEFGVGSIPWIVILDENNEVVYSKEPIEEADDEILLVMNIFPSTIVNPPTDADEIVIDIDEEEPEEGSEVELEPVTEVQVASNTTEAFGHLSSEPTPAPETTSDATASEIKITPPSSSPPKPSPTQTQAQRAHRPRSQTQNRRRSSGSDPRLSRTQPSSSFVGRKQGLGPQISSP